MTMMSRIRDIAMLGSLTLPAASCKEGNGHHLPLEPKAVQTENLALASSVLKPIDYGAGYGCQAWFIEGNFPIKDVQECYEKLNPGKMVILANVGLYGNTTGTFLLVRDK
jgi:hypothetical protein